MNINLKKHQFAVKIYFIRKKQKNKKKNTKEMYTFINGTLNY